MSGRVQNKVALVTAAGQGIGRAIAEALIAEGGIVIATDLADDKLAGLKAKKRQKLDVRRRRMSTLWRRSVANEFGALDILVNCAGYVANGSVLDCTDKDWDFSFDLNVKSMHRTIKTFLPAMLEKKSGSIVNISSAVSSIRGVPNRYAYGATKAAVIGLDQSRRRRLHQAGHPLQRGLPRHHRIAVARGAHRGGSRKRPDNRPTWCGRISSIASRWAASARRRKSPRSPSSLPATRQATLPARRISSTAGWRCNSGVEAGAKSEKCTFSSPAPQA